MTITHRRSGTPEHTSWRKMKERCFNDKAAPWPWYGGRGITVCKRWMIFENFFADMGERPTGTTLDRIDPNGNYEPSNCRWADKQTQTRGQRHVIWVEYNGEKIMLRELCRNLGLPWMRVYQRIRVLKMPLLDALYDKKINGQAILNEQKVIAIRKSTESAKNLALSYGVTVDAIYAVRSRQNWKHVT